MNISVSDIAIKEVHNISNSDIEELDKQVRLFLAGIGCLCGRIDLDAEWIPIAQYGALEGSQYEIEQELTCLDCTEDVYYCLHGHLKIHQGTNCDFESKTITPNFRAEICTWDFKN